MKKTILMMALAALTIVACKPKIIPTELSVPADPITLAQAEGSTIEITFTSNKNWQAYTSADWLTVSPLEGTPETTVIVVTTKSQNEDVEDRSAEISITAEDETAKIVIVQTAKPALTVSEKSFTINSLGGDIVVPAMANIPYTIEIPEDCDWITNSASKAYVEANTTLTVALNKKGLNRSIKLAVKAEGLPNDTIEISQTSYIWAEKMSDLGIAPNANAMVSITVFGDDVICALGDGSAPIILDKKTGKKKGTLSVGDIKVCQVNVDDAGHLLIANYRTYDQKWLDPFTVYKMNSINDTPTAILQSTAYGAPYGSKLAVRGDVTKNALIVTPKSGGTVNGTNFGGCNKVMTWTISDGKAKEQQITINGMAGLGWLAGYWFACPQNTPSIALLGDSMEAGKGGFIMSYYGTNIGEYVTSTAENPGNATVQKVFSPGAKSGNFAYNGSEVRTIAGKKFMVLGTSGFFPQYNDPSKVYVIDVTDMQAIISANAPAIDNNDFLVASPTTTMNYDFDTAIVASNQVALEASGDSGLCVYRIDNNNDIVEALYVAHK